MSLKANQTASMTFSAECIHRSSCCVTHLPDSALYHYPASFTAEYMLYYYLLGALYAHLAFASSLCQASNIVNHAKDFSTGKPNLAMNLNGVSISLTILMQNLFKMPLDYLALSARMLGVMKSSRQIGRKTF
jgi:hypothetical protein